MEHMKNAIETSQISVRYSDQIQAVMKQKSWPKLGQMYLSMIEYPPKDCLAAKRCATSVLRPEFSSWTYSF